MFKNYIFKLINLKNIQKYKKQNFFITILFLFIFIYVPIFIYANEQKEKKNIFDKKNNSVFKDIIKYQSNIQEHNIKEGKSYLKGKAFIKYDDIQIQADCIEFNWKSGDLYAIQKEKFSFLQKDNNKYFFKNLHFNLKNKNIEAKDFYIKRENYMIIANSIENKDPNISLMKKITYISDPFYLQNKDNDPDFYLKTNFLKYYHTKKYIFSGPVFFYWYQVPMPIFLPFLYIPIKELNKYRIIYPKIGIQNKKIYIENIGLSFPIYNILNFKILSSIYNRYKWIFKTNMEYKFKYFYYGFFDFNYQYMLNNKIDYQFKWEHHQNYKSYNGINFNAKINYDKNNEFNDSISYLSVRKKFSNYLLFMDAYMLQNNSNKVGIKFIIPELIFHMKNMPFNNKKNFFLRYMNIENKILIHNFLDFFHEHKKISFYTEFNQKMSIYTYLSFFNFYLKILPKICYNEFYIWKFPYSFVSNFQNIDLSSDIISIPLNFNKIYKSKKNSIFFIHKMEPMLSFYVKYFPPVFYNEKNHFEKKINFILNNDLNIQIKNIFNKKIKIFKNWKYSFLIDHNSIKWDNFQIEGNADFTKGIGVKYKGGINFLKEKNMYFNLSFFCNYETNFLSKKNENKYKKKGKYRYDYFFFDKNNYAHYSIPLNFNIDYYYNNNNNINQKKSLDTFLSINGSINITKYWKIDIHTNYDFFKKKITFANIIFYRDLRSFEMSFNWIPIKNPSWYFFIGIKDKNLRNIIQYNEKN
ncbi:putative LPS assembly protein LptD [Blattabacterium cuenoti]|uniref:putative LPS assembly protein LptD n=1 Tax=Blattabacterium cuenoti TaxID=1653831 RepID=UPI001C6592D9|nr:putative LPS assembly protein LptD [Blattabacterium cuenoti]